MFRAHDHLYLNHGKSGLSVPVAMSDPAVDQTAFLLDERAFYVGNAWAGVLVGTRLIL